MKHKTSFTLSDECQRILKALARKTGLSMAGVIEIAVRHEAERERLPEPPPVAQEPQP